MVQCSAPGCNNSTTKGFLLKRFPRDPERRTLWMTNIQKRNWEPTNNSYVCEVHFDEDQWESKRLDRLKWNAVPTIIQKPLKYTKRKERNLPRVPIPIQPDLSYSFSKEPPPLVYFMKMPRFVTDINNSTTVKTETEVESVSTFDGEVDTKEEKMYKFAFDIREDSKKDAIIAELRKEIAEKDMCILKYEKIICQMNSHLEKLKKRLKFWKDLSERDKCCLKCGETIHKPCHT